MRPGGTGDLGVATPSRKSGTAKPQVNRGHVPTALSWGGKRADDDIVTATEGSRSIRLIATVWTREEAPRPTNPRPLHFPGPRASDLPMLDTATDHRFPVLSAPTLATRERTCVAHP